MVPVSFGGRCQGEFEEVPDLAWYTDEILHRQMILGGKVSRGTMDPSRGARIQKSFSTDSFFIWKDIRKYSFVMW